MVKAVGVYPKSNAQKTDMPALTFILTLIVVIMKNITLVLVA